MTKHIIGTLFFMFFIFSLSWADLWPITVNIKTGKTILLNQDFSWSFYVPPVIRKKVMFHHVDFGITKEQFLKSYASKSTTMKDSPKEGVAYFDDVFEGYPATLFFYFKQGIFVHGEVVFKFNKTKDDDFKRAFSKLEARYTTSLGKPKSDARFSKEWLIDDYSVRLVLTSRGNRLFLGAILDDQLIGRPLIIAPSPNIIPHPATPPVPSKTIKLEQLQDLMETL